MTSMGILFPSSIMNTPFFAGLSALVMLNTLIFVTLAITKVLPELHLSDIVHRRGRREETRSIFPDAPLEP